MNNNLEFSKEKTITVTSELLAVNVGSGDAEVFATPMLINLMEEICSELAKDYLSDSDMTSVGTLVNIKHLAATPEGMNVTAKAVISETDGKRIVFSVEAFDEREVICTGTHERFFVNKDRFTQRAKNK